MALHLRDALKQLIEVIYPARCLICKDFIKRAERKRCPVLICKGCRESFVKISSPRCNICGVPFVSDTAGDHICGDCISNPPNYERLIVPYLYEEKLIAAIYEFKYGGRYQVGKALAELLAYFLIDSFKFPSDMLIIPIPLHYKKLRIRGFNQSIIISEVISEILDMEMDYSILIKIRDTKPQTALKGKERLVNVKDAFIIKDRNRVKDRNILLIDDVVTTTATMNECAKVLKGAGAKRIFGAAIARTVKDRP